MLVVAKCKTIFSSLAYSSLVCCKSKFYPFPSRKKYFCLPYLFSAVAIFFWNISFWMWFEIFIFDIALAWNPSSFCRGPGSGKTKSLLSISLFGCLKNCRSIYSYLSNHASRHKETSLLTVISKKLLVILKFVKKEFFSGFIKLLNHFYHRNNSNCPKY